MNFLVDNAEKIASALPKGTQKKLAAHFNITENAIGQYLHGKFTLQSNVGNREAKRIEILRAALEELRPAADLIQQLEAAKE